MPLTSSDKILRIEIWCNSKEVVTLCELISEYFLNFDNQKTRFVVNRKASILVDGLYVSVSCVDTSVRASSPTVGWTFTKYDLEYRHETPSKLTEVIQEIIEPR